MGSLFLCGRYKIRTCDPLLVSKVFYIVFIGFIRILYTVFVYSLTQYYFDNLRYIITIIVIMKH